MRLTHFLALATLISLCSRAADDKIEHNNRQIRHQGTTLTFDKNSKLQDEDAGWEIDWDDLSSLAVTPSTTAAEAVSTIVRIPRVKSKPVYVRKMEYDFVESPAVGTAHPAYQVIVPTSTEDEYAIYGFRVGVAQQCITLQSIGIGYMVSTNTGTESGTWADHTIYGSWAGRRTDSSGGYVQWTGLSGTSLAVQFVLGVNVGYCAVTIDGDATLANGLPAATADNAATIGVAVGDRYFDGYIASPGWKWVLIATNLADGEHTVRLTHLGTKNSSSSGTRIVVMKRGCGVVGSGTYNTSEFADIYTHCGTLGSFSQMSAFVGVMSLTNISCTDTDFLGDYHTLHTGHHTQTNTSESIILDGTSLSLSSGDIVSGYDLKVSTSAQLMEEIDGMMTNIAVRTISWQFGARAESGQCLVTLSHVWDYPADIRTFYAAVQPAYQRWRQCQGLDYTYGKWVQDGVAYDIPIDDSFLGRYNTSSCSAFLYGDKVYALCLLDGSGSPEVFESVGSQAGAGIYHVCQGRSSRVAKTYASSVANVIKWSAVAGTTTTYRYTIHAGTVSQYGLLSDLLGL